MAAVGRCGGGVAIGFPLHRTPARIRTAWPPLQLFIRINTQNQPSRGHLSAIHQSHAAHLTRGYDFNNSCLGNRVLALHSHTSDV